MKHIFYIIPNLSKVSGGPKSRITAFKKIFIKNKDFIIEGNRKLIDSLRIKKNAKIYIESASNRISFLDLLSLFVLKLKTDNITIFIRDIYIEMFPEEYQTFRKKITLYFNKFSNFYLSWIANRLAFPTKEMGEMFFLKNKKYVKKPFIALAPGTTEMFNNQISPDFTKTIGILYLGGISYKNSGFDTFIAFSKIYKHRYKFYVLSNDKQTKKYSKNSHISFDTIPLQEIPDYIKNNNIAFSLHTRPRNEYDDLTFPIKILDFINFRLPFISEKHVPLIALLSSKYPLFNQLENFDAINTMITQFSNNDNYSKLFEFLNKIHSTNTYNDRYDKVFK